MKKFYFLYKVKNPKYISKYSSFLPEWAPGFPKIRANTNYRYLSGTLAFCFLITDY